jgi:GTP-binding protein
MKITAAEFLKSCASLDQCPAEGLLELACVGRSNVGKSSLINTLLNRKALAKVSRTPGKTRLLNYFRISTSDPMLRHFYLVDLPGYGYAKVAKTMREEWGSLINQYLSSQTTLRGVLLLVDARVAQPQEETAYQWLRGLGHRPIIVLTKMDKLKGNERRNCLTALQERFQLLDDDPVIAHSSLTREGTDALWGAIKSALAERSV